MWQRTRCRTIRADLLVFAQFKRALGGGAPGIHDEPAVKWNAGFEVGIADRRQPDHPASHAESRNSNPFPIDRGVGLQVRDRGADVGHDLIVVQ